MNPFINPHSIFISLIGLCIAIIIFLYFEYEGLKRKEDEIYKEKMMNDE